MNLFFCVICSMIKFLNINMNILIIEKSKTISHILKSTLLAYGYNITVDNEEFNSEHLINRGLFEIILLNTNINGKNNTLDILKRIKEVKDNKCKVLGICSTGTWKDKVAFLNNGGDDVLSYPFPMQELLARVQSLLRRPQSYIDNKMYIGDVLLDTTNKVVTAKNSDIQLSKKLKHHRHHKMNKIRIIYNLKYTWFNSFRALKYNIFRIYVIKDIS